MAFSSFAVSPPDTPVWRWKNLDGANHQIVCRIDSRFVGAEMDASGSFPLEDQAIVKGNGLQNGADLMVAVLPLSQDVQSQVDLGVAPQSNLTKLGGHKKSPIRND